MGLSIDREKVIERIHEAIDMGICVDLFIDVLALLKEQEPVEPIIEQKVFQYARCGKCGQVLHWQGNYCHWCGRSVKWNEG